MKKIWVFGDSILRGVIWSSAAGRYMTTDRLGEREIANDFAMEIVNRSRFGCTVERGSQILRRQFETGDGCDAILLEYGGNDCDFDWKKISLFPNEEHLPHTPIAQFEALYGDAIREIKAKGILPILCNLVPVCSARYLDWISRGLSKENILSWLGDENAIYRYQERYNRCVEKIAEREHCPLIDLRSPFLAVRKIETLYCDDGIHPNEKGQELLRETFLKALRCRFRVSANPMQTKRRASDDTTSASAFVSSPPVRGLSAVKGVFGNA